MITPTNIEETETKSAQAAGASATGAQATGRRKTSTAIVKLQPGKGRIWVNGHKMEDYFVNRPLLLEKVRQPGKISGVGEKFDVVVQTMGGGIHGQADAVSMGIARAFLKMNEELRKLLRKETLLTRDSRKKERKKYGQKKARKRFQYTKR